MAIHDHQFLASLHCFNLPILKPVVRQKHRTPSCTNSYCAQQVFFLVMVTTKVLQMLPRRLVGLVFTTLCWLSRVKSIMTTTGKSQSILPSRAVGRLPNYRSFPVKMHCIPNQAKVKRTTGKMYRVWHPKCMNQHAPNFSQAYPPKGCQYWHHHLAQNVAEVLPKLRSLDEKAFQKMDLFLKRLGLGVLYT